MPSLGVAECIKEPEKYELPSQFPGRENRECLKRNRQEHTAELGKRKRKRGKRRVAEATQWHLRHLSRLEATTRKRGPARPQGIML